MNDSSILRKRLGAAVGLLAISSAVSMSVKLLLYSLDFCIISHLMPLRFHLPLGKSLTWSTAWISLRQELRRNRKQWLMIGWKRWASDIWLFIKTYLDQNWCRFALVRVVSSYSEVYATLAGSISCVWVLLSVSKRKLLNISGQRSKYYCGFENKSFFLRWCFFLQNLYSVYLSPINVSQLHVKKLPSLIRTKRVNL